MHNSTTKHFFVPQETSKSKHRPLQTHKPRKIRISYIWLTVTTEPYYFYLITEALQAKRNSHSVMTGLFSFVLGLCSFGLCSSIFLQYQANVIMRYA